MLPKYRYLVFLLFFISCRQQDPTITLVFTGDLMLDRGIRKAIEQKGVEHLFQNLPYDLHAVDYTVANLECAVCDSVLLKVDKRFSFRANPEWLPCIRKQGINIVSLANNHSADGGENGLLETLASIRKAGIYPVGANAKPEHTGAPILISKGEIRIALFASSFLKSDSRYIYHARVTELTKRMHAYKTLYPSTVIVLMLHWGVEGRTKPENAQIQEAHSLIEAGVDVLVGSHPHVVQAVEHYKKGLIFYSLGNFIFDNNRPPQDKGMLAKLVIGEGHLVGVDTVTFKVYSGYVR